MEKKTSKSIWLAIMSVLILVEIASSVYTFFVTSFPVFQIMSAIPLICVALYGFGLYKKPHVHTALASGSKCGANGSIAASAAAQIIR